MVLDTFMEFSTTIYGRHYISGAFYTFLRPSTFFYGLLHLPTDLEIFLRLSTLTYVRQQLSEAFYTFLHLSTSLYTFLKASTTLGYHQQLFWKLLHFSQ